MTVVDGGAGQLKGFLSLPAPGATFALPDGDAPEVFRKQVLTWMQNAEWRSYYRIPEDIAMRAILGDPIETAGAISFYRGAEGALSALAISTRPHTIWAPRDSYPGYARIASMIGAKLRYYDGANAPQAVETREPAWIVVTSPGNPRDNTLTAESWEKLRAESVLLIIDAAYAMVGTQHFRETVRAATSVGAFVVFSMSKALPLAGLRLGGCIVPVGASRPIGLHHHATVLDAAVVMALCDAKVSDALHAHRIEQLRIHNALLSELLDRRFDVVGRESGVFVTVEGGESLAHLSGKRYRSGITRLDSSGHNLKLLRSS